MSKVQLSEKAVVGHQLLSLDDYIMMNNPEGTNTITDLPIHHVSVIQDKTQNFTHAFDIVKDVGLLPMDRIHQQLLEGKALDPPFNFKNNIGSIDIQYLLTTEPDGTHNLVKHLFIGLNKPRMLTSKLREAAMGEVYCLDCSKFKARRLIPQTVQHLLNGIRGVGIFKKVLNATEVKKEVLPQAQVDDAFDYIEENAPLGNGHNEALRWTLKEKNNPQSPLFHWQQSQIEKAIHNLANAKTLSKINDMYPLSLRDFKNWVLLEVMAPCLRHSLQHSILFAGMSGIGPLSINTIR